MNVAPVLLIRVVSILREMVNITNRAWASVVECQGLRCPCEVHHCYCRWKTFLLNALTPWPQDNRIDKWSLLSTNTKTMYSLRRHSMSSIPFLSTFEIPVIQYILETSHPVHKTFSINIFVFDIPPLAVGRSAMYKWRRHNMFPRRSHLIYNKLFSELNQCNDRDVTACPKTFAINAYQEFSLIYSWFDVPQPVLRFQSVYKWRRHNMTPTRLLATHLIYHNHHIWYITTCSHISIRI